MNIWYGFGFVCLLVTVSECIHAHTDWVRMANQIIRALPSFKGDFQQIATRQRRQDTADCDSILNAIPASCSNYSMLPFATEILSDVDPSDSDLTDEALEEGNRGYEQFCVRECTDTVLSYFHCELDEYEDGLSFTVNFLERGICGKQGNDFCYVLYVREYRDMILVSIINWYLILMMFVPFLSDLIAMKLLMIAPVFLRISVQGWGAALNLFLVR